MAFTATRLAQIEEVAATGHPARSASPAYRKAQRRAYWNHP